MRRIHNHLLDDEPLVFIIHVLPNNEAVKRSRGLRVGVHTVHVAPEC